ncbi:hypothetical protein EJ06DRAFT_531045, partial [Trichodelitschia bisporula]
MEVGDVFLPGGVPGWCLFRLVPLLGVCPSPPPQCVLPHAAFSSRPPLRLAHPFISPAPSSCPLLHLALPLVSPTFSPDLALAATLPEHRLPTWLA